MIIAGIRAAPVYLDRAGTTEKIIHLMQDAASNGADLCVFPETFLSGYPVWVDQTDAAKWNDPIQKKAYAAYLNGSVRADGPELKTITKEAQTLNLFTYLGMVEQSSSGGTVYCSLAAIHPNYGIVGIHRKLMPTFGERLVWGTGDANGLKVHKWCGFRVGGLNCWENWMPLARFSLYSQGEELHVATWPGSPRLTRDITRFIAMEGRLYVLSVGGVLRDTDIPDSFPLKDRMLEQQDRFLSGGTFLVGPDGTPIVGPIKDEEKIVYGEIDLARVKEERQNFDPTGHYSRSDVFSLTVSRKRLEPISFEQESEYKTE